MPAERWVLVGVRDPLCEAAIRKAVNKAGYRATRTQDLEECRKLLQRRVFLCAFLDRHFYRGLERSKSLSPLTYTVLVAQPKEVSRALDWQTNNRLHDWIQTPLEPSSVLSILSRGKTFLRQASELEAIKTTTSANLQSEAALLCTGKWAKAALHWIEQVRNGDEPIGLAGEPGSGKTLLARLLHYNSPRASAPFVVVDCKDRILQDLEKEIFGEIPPRDLPQLSLPLRSKFSLAANGTILFDKSEHLPRRIQQRLAKAIRLGRFSPIGGGDMLALDARMIFTVQVRTTDASLSKLFQRDLAKILRCHVLRIPPLRERLDDVPVIVRSLMQKLRREHGVRVGGVSEKALEVLKEYTWPGNVRQLEGVLWAASVIARRSTIAPAMLTPFLSNGSGSIQEEERALEEIVEERLTHLFARFDIRQLKDLHPMILERVEKPLLRLVLRHTAGNQIKASQLLGINRNTLRRKVASYKIAVRELSGS